MCLQTRTPGCGRGGMGEKPEPGALGLPKGPHSVPLSHALRGVFGLAAVSDCGLWFRPCPMGSKSQSSSRVIFALVRLPLLYRPSRARRDTHCPVQFHSGQDGPAGAARGLGKPRGKHCLGGACLPTVTCWVLGHLRGGVTGGDHRGPGHPRFSMEHCSLTLRGQRARPGFSYLPGSPQPPGPHPPAGLGGP